MKIEKKNESIVKDKTVAFGNRVHIFVAFGLLRQLASSQIFFADGGETSSMINLAFVSSSHLHSKLLRSFVKKLVRRLQQGPVLIMKSRVLEFGKMVGGVGGYYCILLVLVNKPPWTVVVTVGKKVC
ncbi:unnamed protein product [Vicia faba]|uniref:Uncharacterized protein n=1 Tax=Vicia faba TaxID=3906 RepID=A0AAV0ZDD7_VICFA|nr:unnamed protein product [Vicia faba]